MFYHMSNKCFIKNVKQDNEENMKRCIWIIGKILQIVLKCIFDNLYKQWFLQIVHKAAVFLWRPLKTRVVFIADLEKNSVYV